MAAYKARYRKLKVSQISWRKQSLQEAGEKREWKNGKAENLIFVLFQYQIERKL